MFVAWNEALAVAAAHRVGRGRFDSFRFALVTSDGDLLDAVAYARPDSKPDDITLAGLRVLHVLAPGRPGELPVLVVEPENETFEPDRVPG